MIVIKKIIIIIIYVIIIIVVVVIVGPVYVVPLEYILMGKKINFKTILGSVLSFVGVAVLCLGNS